ncbi:hypothetical protein [Citrobacter amalonaticus]|uniref:Uncharacterized protein n=1 Tax=Citrobacter amalonaticus TaxID=35703 RepID=A0AAX2BQ21_CITAM|nr:hypothetical protein [Citrobacter amalonaticus]SBA31118.1 protein of unknown function [Citrobacter amalonaticus]
MESITKQLVKIGHGMSKEIAADEPAVAKLLTELASALDVQYERGNAQEAKCAALAAENAHMQQVIGDVQTLYYESDGIVGYHLNGDIAKWDDVMPDLWAETPSTDAFLAEVRAQGVEMLAAEYESKIEPYKTHDEFMNAHYLKMQAIEARNFAAQIRKGVQS